MTAKKTPARKALRQCAAMLYREVSVSHPALNEAVESATAHRQLDGGLVLTLVKRGRSYFALSLSRKHTYPSVAEQDICIDVFGVPYTAIISRAIEQPWHIIRIRWSQGRGHIIREISQAHLLPGVGLENWQAIIIEEHELKDPSDYNHYSLEELKELLAQLQEVSDTWLHSTPPPPEKAHPAPRSG